MSVTSKSFHKRDKVIQYMVDHSLRLHPVQQKLIDDTLKNPDYIMLGAPEVVQLNMNLMKSIKAKKVLDIGVYTGYSSLGAALAIPSDGVVVACDVELDYVNIGIPRWKEAGVDHKIKLHIRPALETLEELINNGEQGSFDFAFIDADKNNYLNYFNKCIELMHPGSIIAVDNTLWSGKVLDSEDKTSATTSIRAFNDAVAKDERVDISFLNIGDGLTLLFVK